MRHEQNCFWNKITKYVSTEARRGEWRMLFFWWSKSDVDCVFWVHKLYSWWIHFLLKMCTIIWEIVEKKWTWGKNIRFSLFFELLSPRLTKKGFQRNIFKDFLMSDQKKAGEEKNVFCSCEEKCFLKFYRFCFKHTRENVWIKINWRKK